MKMSPNSVFLSALTLLALLIVVSAQSVTILGSKITPCPFNVRVSVSPAFESNGSYIDIISSTKGTNPNSLISHTAGQSNTQRRCFVSAEIGHPNFAALARPLWMEMSGNVNLDAGLTAKVETGIVWGHMAAMTNFTTSTFNGPTPSTTEFVRHLNVTNRSHPASCESTYCPHFPGLPSPASCTVPNLISTFSISGTSNGVGMLGEESDFRYRLYVEWIEGCGSYGPPYYADCASYNRFDELVRFREEGNKTCVDYSKPPPPPPAALMLGERE